MKTTLRFVIACFFVFLMGASFAAGQTETKCVVPQAPAGFVADCLNSGEGISNVTLRQLGSALRYKEAIDPSTMNPFKEARYTSLPFGQVVLVKISEAKAYEQTRQNTSRHEENQKNTAGLGTSAKTTEPSKKVSQKEPAKIQFAKTPITVGLSAPDASSSAALVISGNLGNVHYDASAESPSVKAAAFKAAQAAHFRFWAGLIISLGILVVADLVVYTYYQGKREKFYTNPRRHREKNSEIIDQYQRKHPAISKYLSVHTPLTWLTGINGPRWLRRGRIEGLYYRRRPQNVYP